MNMLSDNLSIHVVCIVLPKVVFSTLVRDAASVWAAVNAKARNWSTG